MNEGVKNGIPGNKVWVMARVETNRFRKYLGVRMPTRLVDRCFGISGEWTDLIYVRKLTMLRRFVIDVMGLSERPITVACKLMYLYFWEYTSHLKEIQLPRSQFSNVVFLRSVFLRILLWSSRFLLPHISFHRVLFPWTTEGQTCNLVLLDTMPLWAPHKSNNMQRKSMTQMGNISFCYTTTFSLLPSSLPSFILSFLLP